MSTATSVSPAIREFAAAVRTALGDLSAEDVDELTDGLEADLTEQAQDTDAHRVDLGDPAAYAAELRTAAGLPVRDSKPAGLVRRVSDRGSALRSEILHDFRSSPRGSQVLDFFLSLRPFWWVLRGWAVYKVIELILGPVAYGVVPTSPFGWVLLLLLVTTSVQWGRGRWLSRRGLRPLRKIASIGAVVALPFLLMLATMSTGYGNNSAAAEPYIPSGLLLNGTSVSNVFAYDADGRLLTDVQLFDQEGRPLVTVDESLRDRVMIAYTENGTEQALVPSSAVPGRTGWNVFPLNQVDIEDVDYSGGVDDQIDPSDAVPVDPPFERVQPLADSEFVSSPVPAPTPGAVPSPTPSAVPSPTPAPPAATPEPSQD